MKNNYIRKAKNKAISDTLRKTRTKRKSQECKVYELKLDYSRMNQAQKTCIKMIFVEGKRIWNHILNWQAESEENDIFKFNASRLYEVIHKTKDEEFVTSDLEYIGSQPKQSIHKQMCANIKTLNRLKNNGYKVGKLRFISELNSIELKQFNHTYKFKENQVKIQGIPGWIKVHGLHQLKDLECANAKLLNKPNGYYLKVTTYKYKTKKTHQGEEIGIDMGISSHITLSNGKQFNCNIEESDRLKRLSKKLARQQGYPSKTRKAKKSNNIYKTKQKIKIEYQKLNNRKNDKANNIVHEIRKYKNIFMQDENLSSWHQDKVKGFSKVIQHSCLGRVRAKLLNESVVLDRFVPTSKTCNVCEFVNEKLSLNDREWVCEQCGIQYDRDLNASLNMIKMAKSGNYKFKTVPTEYRKLVGEKSNKKPVDQLGRVGKKQEDHSL